MHGAIREDIAEAKVRWGFDFISHSIIHKFQAVKPMDEVSLWLHKPPSNSAGE
jgi:hypothetical protein